MVYLLGDFNPFIFFEQTPHITTSQAPTHKNDIDDLKLNGVTDILCLQQEKERRGLEDVDEYTEQVLNRHWLPMPDMTVPPDELVEKALEIINKVVESGGRINVHCMAGLGRTGCIVGAYLITQGYGAQDARLHMMQVRGNCMPLTREQRRFLDDFEEDLEFANETEDDTDGDLKDS